MKLMPGVVALAMICPLLVSPALAGDFAISGRTSTINAAGNGFPCFDSPSTFDAYWGAKAAGDKYGMAEAKQNAILLRPGWRVRMLGTDASQTHSRIRIESGPNTASACWLKFNPAGIVNV